MGVFIALLLALGALLVPDLAMAQVDITGVTGGLSDAGTAIAAIGAAMLVVAGAGIAFKWVLGFLFK